MSTDKIITLHGNVMNGDSATIQFQPKKYLENGIDILVSVKVLEYELRVETFYFGFNLQCFVDQLELVSSGKLNLASLINYNQTLTMNFFRSAVAGNFLTISYLSCLPDAPVNVDLSELRKVLTVEPIPEPGTRFAMSLLKMQGSYSYLFDAMTDLLWSQSMDLSSPYPGASS